MSISYFGSISNTLPFYPLSEATVIALVNKALTRVSNILTTHKYAFFKSILDNLFNVDLDTHLLTYDYLAFRYTEIYWNLVLYFHLRQEINTSAYDNGNVEKELFSFCQKYNFNYKEKQNILTFENLPSNLQLEIIQQIKKNMMGFGVASFCEATDNQFYHFNIQDKSEGIIFNPTVYKFLVKYKTFFEKQNYYDWIKYMEKINVEENTYALANKLDASTEHKNLTPYRKILIEFNQTRCFYCDKPLQVNNDEASPVDHFIPWSFLKDDKLWNFVLTCPLCYRVKNNRIPSMKYFKKLHERNSKLCNMDYQIVNTDFKTYSYSKLIKIWHSAKFNGFKAGWKV